MSARSAWGLIFLGALALFAALAWAFDRDRFHPSSPAGTGGWQQASEERGTEILEAVTLFNKIYQDFYATGGDPRLIDEMPASRAVKHQIFRDIGYLREAGRVLVVDEAETIPVSVEWDGARRAKATVFEEWNFVYQDAETRRPVTEVRGMGQGFRYTLARGREGWSVTGWEPLEIARPEPQEGFLW